MMVTAALQQRTSGLGAAQQASGVRQPRVGEECAFEGLLQALGALSEVFGRWVHYPWPPLAHRSSLWHGGGGRCEHPTGPAHPFLQAARARTLAVRAAAQRETDPKKRVVITGM